MDDSFWTGAEVNLPVMVPWIRVSSLIPWTVPWDVTRYHRILYSIKYL